MLYLKGDFEKLYKLYYPKMFAFAKNYVPANEDAENIVQDVFLLLWEKREVLDIQISLVSYLFALVKNKSLDYLRHKVIADEYKQELSAKLTALELLNYSFTSDEEIEQILMTAINKLPERCRQVFLKSRIEGKKNREIANELNLTVSTVENQMTIALRKLRVELKDYLPLLLFLLDVK